MASQKIPALSQKVMRAIVVSKFGGPEVLELRRDVPVPSPTAGECLIKIAAVGVNPVDTYIRSGNYSRLPKLPYIPGNDVCGTVIFVGADVTGFKEGDKVASFMHCRSGGYAEYCAVHHDWLVLLPQEFDYRKGAAVGVPFFSAFKSLFFKCNAKATDTVLIHGASGGVGIASCQVARSRGMTVFGTAGSKEGMELVSAQGVEAVFNHKEEGYSDKIIKATKNRGVDVIIEMLSNVNLNDDLKLLSQNGTIVVVGCRGPIEINPRLLMAKESKVVGMALYSTIKEEFAQMNRMIRAGIDAGWINPFVGAEYSLNNAVQAHIDIIVKPGSKGKIVLIV